MKIQELRELYEKVDGSRGKEFDKKESGSDVMSDKVSAYFEWEKSRRSFGDETLDGRRETLDGRESEKQHAE